MIANVIAIFILSAVAVTVIFMLLGISGFAVAIGIITAIVISATYVIVDKINQLEKMIQKLYMNKTDNNK
ncbi:MAG: hypothetical protein HFE63_02640 [Clostridiales bacterium]|nr:hypothetical protein [Clostridiales bacterium]